jgi:hypothetical protein
MTNAVRGKAANWHEFTKEQMFSAYTADIPAKGCSENPFTKSI